MADDDRHRARLQRASALEDVGDHRRTGHAMQHFWSRRLDARALAGREDDDMNVGHFDRLIIYRSRAVLPFVAPGCHELGEMRRKRGSLQLKQSETAQEPALARAARAEGAAAVGSRSG